MRKLGSYQQQFKRWVSSLSYTAGTPVLSSRVDSGRGAPMSAKLSKNEITAMLRAWGAGESEASDELVRAVYSELRRQAQLRLRRERPNHTLDTSALINEAYLKLAEQRSVPWRDRGHFFAIASQLMRRILVDHARNRHRGKRGGANENIALDDVVPAAEPAAPDTLNIDIIALDEALERLAAIDPQQVKIVELRHFGGLEVTEVAEVLGISPATVKRDWAMAKAWLKHELTCEARSEDA